MIIKPKYGQSLFDIAIINTGNPLKAFEMAFKNNLNVSDELADREISYTIAEIDDNHQVFEVFKIKNYQPATMPRDLSGVFDNSFDLTFE